MWEWASTSLDFEPDIVIACAGDIPTLEALAAAALLREWLPQSACALRQRRRPDGARPGAVSPARLDADAFRALFTDSVEVIFAFHGYARALHQLIHGRPDDQRFHVHGFIEQGTTTTPFDMVVLNDMSRYHLVLHALDRLHLRRRRPPSSPRTVDAMLERHHQYVRANLEDMPEIRDWVWPF